ncbi:hypothetical protein, conserved [Leishmania tarentolae]|uniref:Uncharacterized protein n=1 Tax=Leishmania tarentolae TaxID=5689 RepID=A0A640L2G2_LEITA|nr:hypothetical protein, conserved [Leishmania tarentolae]
MPEGRQQHSVASGHQIPKRERNEAAPVSSVPCRRHLHTHPSRPHLHTHARTHAAPLPLPAHNADVGTAVSAPPTPTLFFPASCAMQRCRGAARSPLSVAEFPSHDGTPARARVCACTPGLQSSTATPHRATHRAPRAPRRVRDITADPIAPVAPEPRQQAHQQEWYAGSNTRTAAEKRSATAHHAFRAPATLPCATQPLAAHFSGAELRRWHGGSGALGALGLPLVSPHSSRCRSIASLKDCSHAACSGVRAFVPPVRRILPCLLVVRGRVRWRAALAVPKAQSVVERDVEGRQLAGLAARRPQVAPLRPPPIARLHVLAGLHKVVLGVLARVRLLAVSNLLTEARLRTLHRALKVPRADLARVRPRLLHRLRPLHHLPLPVLLLLVAAQQVALLEAVPLSPSVLVWPTVVKVREGVPRVRLPLARGAHHILAVPLPEGAVAVLVHTLVSPQQHLWRSRGHLQRVARLPRLPVLDAQQLVGVHVPVSHNVAVHVRYVPPERRRALRLVQQRVAVAAGHHAVRRQRCKAHLLQALLVQVALLYRRHPLLVPRVQHPRAVPDLEPQPQQPARLDVPERGRRCAEQLAGDAAQHHREGAARGRREPRMFRSPRGNRR